MGLCTAPEIAGKCTLVMAGCVHQEEKQAMAFALHTTQAGVVLHGVSWTTYQQLLADRGLHSGVRFAFDRGTLEIMAPNFEHESINRLLVQLVIAIALARNLDYLDAGSTTFDREDIDRGFEPDSCFYFEHAPHIRGKKTINLQTDPPPDLVIEVDITHPSLDKFPIYAALGIPEVWRYNGTRIDIHCLRDDAYTRVASSTILDGVTPGALERMLALSATMSGTEWFKTVMVWAQSC
jgi:Uma2 family endonuclease